MSKAQTLDLFNELSTVAAPAIWEVSMHESAAAYDVVATALGNRWRADQLRRAKLNSDLVTVRSGRNMWRVRAIAERVEELRDALKKCHRKQAQKAVLRSYPKFMPGMSTAEYVAKFASANFGAADVLPFASLNTEPCALYENGALDFDVIEEQIEESQEVQQIDAIPESAEGVAPWADVLASTVESIGAVEEGAFSLMVEAFEDINYHSESLMVRCLRAGREDLASAVAHLLRLQNSPEYRGLNGAQCDARAAVSAMLAGEPGAHISDEAASILASWGLVIRKPQASEAFAAMMRAARDAKRIARQAIAQASASSATSIPDDSDGNPYPYLQPIADTHSGGVAAAKNIRLVLKNQFPGVKFKVTSDYSSVNVRWIDGPVTGAVDDALAPFDIGHSDSQSDYFYTERTRFSEKFGGVQYLFTHRELSESKITASINAVFGEDGPTFAEWKAGTPWSQVARKGSYRDAQMWNSYEWLAMVRRDANEK